MVVEPGITVDWLPEELGAKIRENEPRRFVNLVDELQNRWRNLKETKTPKEKRQLEALVSPLEK